MLTSPRLFKKTTSPWLRLRWRCASGTGKKTGVATSKGAEASREWPKARDANSPCGNMENGECLQMDPLNNCSLTGIPDVATAQHGLRASIIPLGTTCSVPRPPTACSITTSLQHIKPSIKKSFASNLEAPLFMHMAWYAPAHGLKHHRHWHQHAILLLQARAAKHRNTK